MNCKKCGRELNEGSFSCDFCGEYVTDNQQSQQPQQTPYSTYSYDFNSKQQETENINAQIEPDIPERSENIITGLIGALIGAGIGALVIVLIGQLGFIASLSGAVLAFCTLKGYELLGRRLGIGGIIICLLLIAMTPYFADRIVWALQLAKEFEAQGISMTFSEAYKLIPNLIKDGLIEKSAYIKGLLMLYVFALLGGFGTIRDVLKR